MHLPLLVRENTVLPMSGEEERPQWRLADPLTLNLFHIADGADIVVRVPTSDNAHAAVFNCKRAGEKLTLTSDGGATNVRLLLRSGGGSVARVANGKVAREVPEGLLIEWADPSKPITLTLTNGHPR